jgi:hypothetical protein
MHDATKSQYRGRHRCDILPEVDWCSLLGNVEPAPNLEFDDLEGGKNFSQYLTPAQMINMM